AWFQDCGRAVPNLGAGCLSRRTDASDSVSLRRFQSSGVRRVNPCFATVHEPAANTTADFRDRAAHIDLRQSRSAAPDEPETTARVLQHRACGLSAYRRGLFRCPRDYLLPRRLPIDDPAEFHSADNCRAANRRRDFRFRRARQTFAISSVRDVDRNGLACRCAVHSGISGQVLYLLRRRSTAPDRAHRCWSDHCWLRILLLSQSVARDVLAVRRQHGQDLCKRSIAHRDQCVDYCYDLVRHLSAADPGCVEEVKNSDPKFWFIVGKAEGQSPSCSRGPIPGYSRCNAANSVRDYSRLRARLARAGTGLLASTCALTFWICAACSLRLAVKTSISRCCCVLVASSSFCCPAIAASKSFRCCATVASSC